MSQNAGIERPSKVVSFRLSKREYTLMTRRCDSAGIASVSEMARLIIRELLETNIDARNILAVFSIRRIESDLKQLTETMQRITLTVEPSAQEAVDDLETRTQASGGLLEER